MPKIELKMFLHSGMEALCRLFPIKRDWKAELKKPSPGPLCIEKNKALALSYWINDQWTALIIEQNINIGSNIPSV